LDNESQVPGIDAKTFQEQAEATKKGCPVSRALTGPEIRLKASLKN
jgi:osmotically inducible protein OsmC